MHTNRHRFSLNYTPNTTKIANCKPDWSIFTAPLQEELDNKLGKGKKRWFHML